MQPRNVTGLPADHGDADVTVADTDRVIGAYRFFFFHRARPGSFHAEHRFVKPRLADEIFTDDGKVLNPGEHRPPFGRLCSKRFNCSSRSTPSFILPAFAGEEKRWGLERFELFERQKLFPRDLFEETFLFQLVQNALVEVL